MSSKTFSVKRENRPGIHVSGFPADNHQAFINIKFGDTGQDGQFQVLLYMADACALSIALENAINHAELRAVEAADIGLLDEAA
jgi:hypothetical protein